MIAPGHPVADGDWGTERGGDRFCRSGMPTLTVEAPSRSCSHFTPNSSLSSANRLERLGVRCKGVRADRHATGSMTMSSVSDLGLLGGGHVDELCGPISTRRAGSSGISCLVVRVAADHTAAPVLLETIGMMASIRSSSPFTELTIRACPGRSARPSSSTCDWMEESDDQRQVGQAPDHRDGPAASASAPLRPSARPCFTVEHMAPPRAATCLA